MSEEKTNTSSHPSLWRGLPWWSWLFGGGLVLLGLVFGPHLRGGYVWDDVYLVQHHPALQHPEGWKVLWRTDLWGGATGQATQLYHPLPMWTLWAEAQWWGLAVYKARLVNVVLHFLVGLFLAGLIWRWLALRGVAVLMALLFWTQPLMTETVMWITGRHDGLAVLFSLAALWIWPIEGPLRSHKVLAIASSSLLCVAALLCKEPYIVLPLLLSFLPLLLVSRAKRLPWSLGWSALPFLGILGVMLLRRSLGITAESAQLGAPFLVHLQHFFTILWRYVGVLLSWQGAPTIASYRPMPSLFWALGAVFAVCLLGTATWFFWKARKDAELWEASDELQHDPQGKETEAQEGLLSVEQRARAWGVLLWALLAYGLCWGPHLLSMPMIGLWGNRYAYLPWALLLIAVAALSVLLRPWVSRRLRGVIWSLACLWVVYGGVLTFVEASHWKNNLTLYQADVLRDPRNGRAMYHFAHAVRMRFGCKRSVQLFQRAAMLDPTYIRSWQNAAGCLLQLRRYREALAPAQQAVERSPASPRLRYNLALALYHTQQKEAAIAQLREAVALNPRYLPAQRLFLALRSLPSSRPMTSRPSSFKKQ